MIVQLAKLRRPDLRVPINKSGLVPLDTVVEFFLLETMGMKQEVETTVEDLFATADLNRNGYIDFEEFRVLASMEASLTEVEVRDYFGAYAEPVMAQVVPGGKEKLAGGQAGQAEKAMTMEQFQRLCMENDLFAIKEKNDT